MAKSALESFLSSLKTERTTRTVYHKRDNARANASGEMERCNNPRRWHAKLGYMRPTEFEVLA